MKKSNKKNQKNQPIEHKPLLQKIQNKGHIHLQSIHQKTSKTD